MFLTYQDDNQLASWWDLNILVQPGWEKLKTQIESVNIPFQKFDIERKVSGEVIINGIEHPAEVTITFRETTSFSVYKFFDNWIDKFYDKSKKVFRMFNSDYDYNASLLDMKLTYYKGPLFNVGVAVAGIDVLGALGFDPMTPTYSFYMSACKPVGIQDLSASYDGGPLMFSVTLIAETIRLWEE